MSRIDGASLVGWEMGRLKGLEFDGGERVGVKAKPILSCEVEGMGLWVVGCGEQPHVRREAV
jgi:hypothetical protein